MLAVLERRHRGRILTLVHIVVYSPSSQLRRFLARRLHALWRPLSHFTCMFSPRTISEVVKSLNVRVPSPFLLLSPWSKFSQVFAEKYAVPIPLRSFTVFEEVQSADRKHSYFVDGFDVQVWGIWKT